MIQGSAIQKDPGSFRDSGGFIFYMDGRPYRQINTCCQSDFDLLTSSGLYDNLTKDNLLIPHSDVSLDIKKSGEAYKIIQPEPIPFISYPYEWCFSQLKDAALLTLDIQKRAMDHGMTLKDCSAFNVQFKDGAPVFIDTLSFEKYEEGTPWVAYRQFCQHFLAPLALYSTADFRLNQLSKVFIDGIPLELASKLLPGFTKLNFGLLIHIHLHSRSQKKFGGADVSIKKLKMNRTGVLGLIDNLESVIKKLHWKAIDTEWADYYDNTNYSKDSIEDKARIVKDYLSQAKPSTVCDLGANTGMFSRLASDEGIPTIAFDIDPAAVEINYRQVKKKNEKNILPLVIDLTNPSPKVGWANEERLSFQERLTCDTVIALALIHHLSITNHVPLEKVAKFLRPCCRSLVIEFVPHTDSQAERLLRNRNDISSEYTQENFENTFRKYFKIVKKAKVKGLDRVIYLME